MQPVPSVQRPQASGLGDSRGSGPGLRARKRLFLEIIIITLIIVCLILSLSLPAHAEAWRVARGSYAPGDLILLCQSCDVLRTIREAGLCLLLAASIPIRTAIWFVAPHSEPATPASPS